jgi:hypothetical protein
VLAARVERQSYIHSVIELVPTTRGLKGISEEKKKAVRSIDVQRNTRLIRVPVGLGEARTAYVRPGSATSQIENGIGPSESVMRTMLPEDESDRSYSAAALKSSVRLGLLMMALGSALTIIGIVSFASLVTSGYEASAETIPLWLIGAGAFLLIIFGFFSIQKATRLKYVSYLEERRLKRKTQT